MDTVAPSTDSPRHDMASDNARFLEELGTIGGHSHVLTSPESTQRYRTGFRFGTGPALAVVRPFRHGLPLSAGNRTLRRWPRSFPGSTLTGPLGRVDVGGRYRLAEIAF